MFNIVIININLVQQILYIATMKVVYEMCAIKLQKPRILLIFFQELLSHKSLEAIPSALPLDNSPDIPTSTSYHHGIPWTSTASECPGWMSSSVTRLLATSNGRGRYLSSRVKVTSGIYMVVYHSLWTEIMKELEIEIPPI